MKVRDLLTKLVTHCDMDDEVVIEARRLTVQVTDITPNRGSVELILSHKVEEEEP